MIRKRQQRASLLLSIVDGLLLVGAYVLSVWLWLTVWKHDGMNMAASSALLPAAAVYAALIVLVQALLGVYDPGRKRGRLAACWAANLLGILCGMSVMYLLRLMDFSRGVLLLFYFSGCSLLTVRSLVTVRLMRLMGRRGRRLVLVIGTGAAACRYRDDLQAHPELGLTVAGFIGPKSEALPVLADYDGMGAVLADTRVQEAIIALDSPDSPLTNRIIDACESAGVRASVVPAYNDVIPYSATVQSVGGTRLISLRSNPLDNLGWAFLKRSTDVVLSLLLLILTAPLMAVCMLGVRLSGPGPVIFRQERVGLDRRTFTMLKLRTMRTGSGPEDGWTTRDDPRRTRFGALLRKCSIDELPQLVNVLKGDMSLVGPRPEVPRYVEEYARSVPRYMIKHQVRPGMTGWAQVNGWRGDTDIASRVKCDVWYIEHWTPWLDLRILLRTAFGGFINREQLGGDKK